MGRGGTFRAVSHRSIGHWEVAEQRCIWGGGCPGSCVWVVRGAGGSTVLAAEQQGGQWSHQDPLQGRAGRCAGPQGNAGLQLCLELSCPWPDTQVGAAEWTLRCFSLDIEKRLIQGISRDSSAQHSLAPGVPQAPRDSSPRGSAGSEFGK